MNNIFIKCAAASPTDASPSDVARVLAAMSEDVHQMYMLLALLVCLVVAYICHIMFRGIFRKLAKGGNM